MPKRLTDKGVAALKARAKPYAHPDPELRGHWIRVYPSGAKTFLAVTRTPSRKQVWVTIGPCDAMTIEEARDRARAILGRVRAGLPANEVAGETFGEVATAWLKRHVAAKELRTGANIRRLLELHVLPRWGGREFLTIKRSDLARLLDAVEDRSGARTADKILTVVRSLMGWYASRSDDWTPPVARGMRRQNPSESARSRVLTDDELRSIWSAAETAGTYGGMIRMLLLTGQRLAKVQNMKWSELDGGAWTMPTAVHEKQNAGTLILPQLALDVIAAQPQLGEFVFQGRGSSAFSGFTRSKRRLDRISGVSGWRLHDLRRTARSLMSRTGTNADHAERVLGHAISGIRSVYDRHEFKAEKADALRRLAALIETIVHPRPNVVPLAKPVR
jgi:integrase